MRSLLAVTSILALSAPAFAAAPSTQHANIPAYAKGAEMQQLPKQVTLSAQQVQNFMAAYPAVKALADKYQSEWKDDDLGQYKGNWAQKVTQALETHGALGQFNNTIVRYGFPSAENFWQVAFSIILAAHASDPEMAGSQAKLDQAVAEVNANASLSPEQKAQILASLQHSRGMIQNLQPPAGNKELVAPYKDKIETMMDFKEKSAGK